MRAPSTRHDSAGEYLGYWLIGDRRIYPPRPIDTPLDIAGHPRHPRGSGRLYDEKTFQMRHMTPEIWKTGGPFHWDRENNTFYGAWESFFWDDCHISDWWITEEDLK